METIERLSTLEARSKAAVLIGRDYSFRYQPVQSGLSVGWLGFIVREPAYPIALLFWQRAKTFPTYCEHCGYKACDHFQSILQMVQEAVRKG